MVNLFNHGFCVWRTAAASQILLFSFKIRLLTGWASLVHPVITAPPADWTQRNSPIISTYSRTICLLLFCLLQPPIIINGVCSHFLFLFLVPVLLRSDKIIEGRAGQALEANCSALVLILEPFWRLNFNGLDLSDTLRRVWPVSLIHFSSTGQDNQRKTWTSQRLCRTLLVTGDAGKRTQNHWGVGKNKKYCLCSQSSQTTVDESHKKLYFGHKFQQTMQHWPAMLHEVGINGNLMSLIITTLLLFSGMTVFFCLIV